jgi:hypothetical protein
MRLIAVVGLLLFGATAASVHGATAKAVPLNWHETLRVNSRPLIVFTVSSLRFANGEWRVRAAFTNRWERPLRIVSNNFALAAYHSRIACAFRFPRLLAKSFTPRLPSFLPPGSTWRGTFRGSGWPPKRPYVRIVFASFASNPRPYPRVASFGWITDHVYSLRTGKSTFVPGRPC